MTSGRSSGSTRVAHAAIAALVGGLLAPAAASAASIYAPDSTLTGTLHGHVVAASGPVKYANLVVLGARRGALTDSKGAFRITLVPAGALSLRIQSVGFVSTTVPVHVTAGRDTEVTVRVERDTTHRVGTIVWPPFPEQDHPVANCDPTSGPWGAGDPAFRDIPRPDTTGWWVASGSIFDFPLPPEFHRRHTMGVDSEARQWRADSTFVGYDLGNFTGLVRPASKLEIECLGGRLALVEFYTCFDGPGQCMEVYFADLGLGIFAHATSAAQLRGILGAVRTIRFHDIGAPPLLTGPPPPFEPLPQKPTH